jgi:hypothetical protein
MRRAERGKKIRKEELRRRKERMKAEGSDEVRRKN